MESGLYALPQEVAERTPAPDKNSTKRTIDLQGATGIGVGAIVGGGIMVLAGVAFSSAGPAAVVAFAINGFLAYLTAMSYAEISTSFPESGGTYAFAKKFLNVRAAFGVGWILWFAYIVAGVLYALGFAAFLAEAIVGIRSAMGYENAHWLMSKNFVNFTAVSVTALYALSLIRKSSGGGNLATIGKVCLFALIVLAGLVGVARQPLVESRDALAPFFDGGFNGLIAAAGFTFIAVQGFDLIPAIGGEIKNPTQNIPKAMFRSIGIAMAIYLPLLLIVSTVGVESGESIKELAKSQGDTVFATAVSRFMGPVGYWLIVVAAILSTLSALQANLLAASRVALTMAKDHTLPPMFARRSETHGTPIMAIYASALALVAIIFMVPDVGAAGSAASLIFLVSFLLAHLMAYLSRKRGGVTDDSFKTPFFPLVPLVGTVACGALAIFQAIKVPDAGGIALFWLGFGVLLYVGLFKSGAETADASSIALDPRLANLRGKRPLVLLPIANPANAKGMIQVANSLAPSEFARVLLLSVVDTLKNSNEVALNQLGEAQKVLAEALGTSYEVGHTPEALITAAPDPWEEIRRVAELHDCESLLIGLGTMPETGPLVGRLTELLNELDCDVAVMRSEAGWSLDRAKKILVPVGGRGEEHLLRARILTSICRELEPDVTFVRVLPKDATEDDVSDALRGLGQMAEVKVQGMSQVTILRSDNPSEALLNKAKDYDLMVLGLQQGVWGRRAFGDFSLKIARHSNCPVILLSSRPAHLAKGVVRQLEDVAQLVPWPKAR